MKIVIGTDNPVKIRAARNVLRKLYPHAKITALVVPSGIPGQPLGDEETRRGAANRAHAARVAARADWGVGIEGGILTNEFGTMTCAWCAIEDRAGHVGIGGSSNMLLPDTVVARVKAGVELGQAMDEFAKTKDVKHRMGAIGVMTKGLSDRQRAYEFIVKMAVVRFLWKGKYM